MAWVFGRASDAEIETLRRLGCEVEIGKYEGMEGFYGTPAEIAENNADGDKDIRIYVDCNVSDLLRLPDP